VSARDLEAIEGDAGPRARLGTSRTEPPAFAVDGVVGAVALERGAAREDVAERAFAREDDRVATGEGGLARLAFPLGASGRLGPATVVKARRGAEGQDALELEAGELWVSARGRASEELAFDVALAPGVTVHARGSVVEARRAKDGRARVVGREGKSRVEGPGFRLDVGAGLGVAVDRTPDGIRITADPSNAEALELVQGQRASPLAPGQSLVAGDDALATARSSGSWRLVTIKGDVQVRRASLEGSAPGRFVAVPPAQAGQVRLEAGDALATAAGAEASLVRADGAQASLGESSELVLDGLELACGSARVDALRAPVPLRMPPGEARLSLVSVDVSRPRARDASSIEVTVVRGEARLPLPGAVVRARDGARLALEGGPDAVSLRTVQGAAAIASVPRAGVDPGVAVSVPEGRELRVVALTANAAPQGIALELEGGLELAFGPERTDARVSLEGERPSVKLGEGPKAMVAPGTKVAFARDGATPLARLASGERLLLPEPGIELVLERDAFSVGETVVALRDGVVASLHGPSGRAAVVLGTRAEDRLEVPKGAHAVVGRRGADHTRFELDDGRRLWIEDGAPPVQARLGSWVLTVPGAPPLVVPDGKRATVLATRDGELVLLDDPSAARPAAGLAGLRALPSGAGPFVLPSDFEHLPLVLDEPPPASPTRR
jgi:hypothetical protein